VDWFPKLILQF